MAYLYQKTADGHIRCVAQVTDRGAVYDLMGKNGPVLIGMIDKQGYVYDQAFTAFPGRHHESCVGFVNKQGNVYSRASAADGERLGHISKDGSIYYCYEECDLPDEGGNIDGAYLYKGRVEGDIRAGAALLLLPLGVNEAAEEMRGCAGISCLVTLVLFALMLLIIF